MNTHYRQSLQERISRLAEELEQLETQQAAVIGSRPKNGTPEQRDKYHQEVIAAMNAFRKVGKRLHQSKRLLARAQGDEYDFDQPRGDNVMAEVWRAQKRVKPTTKSLGHFLRSASRAGTQTNH